MGIANSQDASLDLYAPLTHNGHLAPGSANGKAHFIIFNPGGEPREPGR